MTDYSQPPQQSYPPAAQTSAMAIVSLVSGIIGWTILPGLGSIVAIIMGHIAKGEIRRGMGQITGDGLATFGLLLGYAQIILALCSLCIFGILMVTGIGAGILEGFNQGWY